MSSEEFFEDPEDGYRSDLKGIRACPGVAIVSRLDRQRRGRRTCALIRGAIVEALGEGLPGTSDASASYATERIRRTTTDNMLDAPLPVKSDKGARFLLDGGVSSKVDFYSNNNDKYNSTDPPPGNWNFPEDPLAQE